MLKWLAALYHSMTSSSAGAAITKLKATADADYHAAISKVETVYAKDIAVVTAVAHHELDALQHLVEAAKDRIHALLASEVDLGDRNLDAATLHRDLTKAVS